MSHFTKLRTKFVDEAVLRKALVRAGYQPTPGPSRIGGWKGQLQAVQIGIPNLRENYGIGFIRERSDRFSAIADWTELEKRDFSQRDFMNAIAQSYGYESVMTSMLPQGFEVASQDHESDGSIRIVLRRAV